MTPMVETLARYLRGCALLTAAVLLAACTRVIAGAVQPADGDTSPVRAPVPVAQLLIEPDQFPPQYPAAVLDDAGVDRALQEIDGVPTGAVVTPGDCMPPVPSHTEAGGVEGVDDVTASRLIVVVTRPAPPMRQRLDQLRACVSFTVARDADLSTVDVTVLPAPPIDADETYAVEQKVTTPDAERMILTFAAQIGDTRVSATWLQDPAVGDADTTSLDTLFRDAVVKLRREG
jgi:hypothetical protein